MIDVSVCKDLGEIHRLWQRHWPQRCLFDLLPLRACFQRRFQHAPHVLVARQKGIFCGLLALSWIDEGQYYGHFPGELWHGKTWLEQNRVLAADEESFLALWEAVPDVAQIRYLHPDGYLPEGASVTMDEVGYLFGRLSMTTILTAIWVSFPGKPGKRSAVRSTGSTGGAYPSVTISCPTSTGCSA